MEKITWQCLIIWKLNKPEVAKLINVYKLFPYKITNFGRIINYIFATDVPFLYLRQNSPIKQAKPFKAGFSPSWANVIIVICSQLASSLLFNSKLCHKRTHCDNQLQSPSVCKPIKIEYAAKANSCCYYISAEWNTCLWSFSGKSCILQTDWGGLQWRPIAIHPLKLVLLVVNSVSTAEEYVIFHTYWCCSF